MAELSSSQKIAPQNIKPKKTKERANDKQDLSQRGNVGVANDQKKTPDNNLIKDSFKSTNPKQKPKLPINTQKNELTAPTNSAPKEEINPFTNQKKGIISNLKINLSKTQENISGRLNHQNLFSGVNNVQQNSRAMIENFLARTVNIMDKIAAVYGEREKDIRERLSDTFKTMEIKTHELLGKVDTSFEQKDHHKEKKLKDQEYKQESEEEGTHRID